MPDYEDFPRTDQKSQAIPDMRDLPMALILDGDDSAFGNAVRRAAWDVSRPSDTWSAHGTTP